MLRKDIYDKLRQEILSCELRPSTELREQRLADRFAVSKVPVREALLQLGNEGLVRVLPRQGYCVAPVSQKDALEMLFARAVLEAAGAQEAARVASDDALQNLGRFRVFEGDDHSDGFTAYNQAFHCAVADCSGNSFLAKTVKELVERMDRIVRISVELTGKSGTEKGFIEDHVKIIDALQARDGKRAARVLRTHIAAAERQLCRVLERLAIVA